MPAWSSEFRRFTRSWHLFFFPCVLIYCPSGKPSKVLNLVGTLASPCSDLYSVSLLKPLSHSTASLVKNSRGHAEIKLETCWLCKWNIKIEFLKVPPPRSSIFEEGHCQTLDFFIRFRSDVWPGQRDGRRLFRHAVPGCFPDLKGVLWLVLCAWNNCLPDP